MQDSHDDSYVIDVQHARKRLGTTQALHDVSLRVSPGSIFGFLGPNGAGKTTTLRALIGMIRLDGGSARVLGMDPWSDRVALHARVGYLPSGAATYPHVRGIEALDYAAELSGGRRATSPLRAAVQDAVQLSESDLQRDVRDYSKGMRQKLAIIQALQHDPELLLLDEPSEGLDPLIQHSLNELLRDRAAQGRTVVFSSHVLGEVEQLCDCVAIIRKGDLIVQSPLSDLRDQRPRVVSVRVHDAASLTSLGEAFERRDDDHQGRAVFHVTAPPDEIVAALARLQLDDVLIEEPSLDDVFRSYYTGEEE